MYSLIQQAVDTLSYFGLVLLMFAENLFPPIPSELIMPLAGYLSSQGKLSLIGAIVAGTVGSVLGALPFYGVARWFGHDRMSAFVERHGDWIILFGRLVPGVRSLISLPAGVYAMPIGRFLLLTASGSAIWSAFLAVAGYQLAENFRALEAYIGPASKLVLGLLVLAWLYHIGKHYWRRRYG